MKNVVFMGTPDFAVPVLKRLIESEYTVTGVFTQPDKPKGRGGKMSMSPVKEAALEAGIPVFQPVKIREPENLEILKGLNPDVIVVAAFGQIIPKSILDLPKYHCINVHASLLPMYRGAAPIQWSVINGDAESGVTTMKMAEGLDTGDMIEKVVVPLAADETGGSLFDKLAEVGADLCMHTLKSLEEGTATFTPQPEESPTPYASMLTRAMGEIDWNKSAVAIERLVRGLNPWPSAFTYLNGKQFKIWESSVADAGTFADKANAQAGEIVLSDGKQIGVQTGEGVLLIHALQLEGKKRMDTDAFLRGYSVEVGTLLGGK